MIRSVVTILYGSKKYYKKSYFDGFNRYSYNSIKFKNIAREYMYAGQRWDSSLSLQEKGTSSMRNRRSKK